MPGDAVDYAETVPGIESLRPLAGADAEPAEALAAGIGDEEGRLPSRRRLGSFEPHL